MALRGRGNRGVADCIRYLYISSRSKKYVFKLVTGTILQLDFEHAAVIIIIIIIIIMHFLSHITKFKGCV